MIRKPIIPPGQEFSYNRLHFAPAFRVGSTVYVSGVIGRGADGVPDDPADEFALAFELMATTLEAAGCSSLIDPKARAEIKATAVIASEQ